MASESEGTGAGIIPPLSAGWRKTAVTLLAINGSTREQSAMSSEMTGVELGQSADLRR